MNIVILDVICYVCLQHLYFGFKNAEVTIGMFFFLNIIFLLELLCLDSCTGTHQLQNFGITVLKLNWLLRYTDR